MFFRPNTSAMHYADCVLALVTGLLSAATSSAQPLLKVPFPYSPINTSALPFMIAKDAKFFEKHGVDVDLILMGASALIIQSMLSGAANIAGFGGPALVTNVLRGGDVIAVAAKGSLLSYCRLVKTGSGRLL